MPRLRNALLGTVILVLSVGSCVDPAGKFSEFDLRVIDAGMPAVGTGCKLGEIPDVTGEFLMSLDTSIAPGAFLKFIGTTVIDKTVNPAVLSITLQPLCTQAAAACTLNEPLGAPFVMDDTDVDENCDYTVPISGIALEGGANPISGSALVGELVMSGNLRDADLYCGIVNGDADVGSIVNIDNSTFGAIRIAPGTTGDALPDSVGACPAE